MTAQEVIQSYKEGNRDFRGVSVCGQSFEGQNLSEADFSEADIRSTNFTKATLNQTTFVGAKGGIQKSWRFIQQLLATFIGLFGGCFSWIYVGINVQLFAPEHFNIGTFLAGIISSLLVAISMLSFANHGFTVKSLTTILIAGVGAAITAVPLAVVIGAFVSPYAAGGVLGSVIVAPIATVACIGTAVAVAVGGNTARVILALISLVSLSNSAAATTALAIFIFSAYIDSETHKNNEKFHLIRIWNNAFNAIGGTSFIGADLTDAVFDGAFLNSTNFKEAILNYVSWKNAKKLNFSCWGKSILANTKVQELLVYGDGTNQDYQGLNLSNINLAEAKLSGANLKQVDLSGSILYDAELYNANLREAICINTNFTKVKLTGACIQGWNIDHSTKLDDVDCKYMFLLEPDRDRRPYNLNKEFEVGDFTRLYQQAVETLDLIFKDGIDWKSFAVTLQTLNTEQKLNIEGENKQLSVRAIEKRDDGSFVIRVDVPDTIDKAKIEAEFKKKYQKELAAQEQQYRKQLQAKDIDIEHYFQQNTKLINIVGILSAAAEAALLNKSPISTIYNNFMFTNESKGDTYNQTGVGVGHISGGSFTGNTFAANINESPNHSLVAAAAEIRDLLSELEKSYPTTTTTEKMIIAAEAIKHIEANPDYKKRIVNALKDGGIAALEKAIDNPIGAFLKGAFEGWEKEN